MFLTFNTYLPRSFSAGPDCVKYLIFQRHLIGLTFIWTVISCAITLPINYMGSNTGIRNNDPPAVIFLRFSIQNLINKYALITCIAVIKHV